MSKKVLKVIIFLSLLVILSTGCAYNNKRSLMEYDYPPAPQEYYPSFQYPLYYPATDMPYQNSPYLFYSPYFYLPPYQFMHP